MTDCPAQQDFDRRELKPESNWRLAAMQRQLDWLVIEAARSQPQRPLICTSIRRLRQEIRDIAARN